MYGFQSNDFDEAGMFGREAKPEWQLSSVIASFNDNYWEIANELKTAVY